MPAASMLLAALSVSSIALPYIDKEAIGLDGSSVVIRTSELPDLHGGSVKVEQRLKVLGGGRYEIDPTQQSPATKIYHEALCLDKGMKPYQGKGVLSGDMAVGGFDCYSEDKDSEAPSSIDDGTVGSTSPFNPRVTAAQDYVFARAPSGSAPALKTFLAYGALRLNSSVAGRIVYEISLDNRRCLWENTEYRDVAPVVINITKQVACIGHRPGFLRTVAKACIPKTCGSDSGTWSISERLSGRPMAITP